TVILCDNDGQLERLEELLGADAATLAIGALDGGFGLPSLRVLTDHEIFRRARRLRRPRRYREASATAAARALQQGDYVVHLEHGIGLYRGIQTIAVGAEGGTLEVAVVEYEGGDRLNVPLYRLDQLEPYRAAEEAKRDMERARPMDRLLVGDVGYGKTEVALRAAFKAVQAGKQVALLAPTTILAEQHGRTFRERLADYPVHIEVLSRFRGPSDTRRVVQGLERGD